MLRSARLGTENRRTSKPIGPGFEFPTKSADGVDRMRARASAWRAACRHEKRADQNLEPMHKVPPAPEPRRHNYRYTELGCMLLELLLELLGHIAGCSEVHSCRCSVSRFSA